MLDDGKAIHDDENRDDSITRVTIIISLGTLRTEIMPESVFGSTSCSLKAPLGSTSMDELSQLAHTSFACFTFVGAPNAPQCHVALSHHGSLP